MTDDLYDTLMEPDNWFICECGSIVSEETNICSFCDYDWNQVFDDEEFRLDDWEEE